MSEFQTITSILMALVIGFVIGRGGRKSHERDSQYITQEEEALLSQSLEDYNPMKDVHWDVLAAIKSGQKLQAIKLYREHHSAGLKEAKDAVEAIINNM